MGLGQWVGGAYVGFGGWDCGVASSAAGAAGAVFVGGVVVVHGVEELLFVEPGGAVLCAGAEFFDWSAWYRGGNLLLRGGVWRGSMSAGGTPGEDSRGGDGSGEAAEALGCGAWCRRTGKGFEGWFVVFGGECES